MKELPYYKFFPGEWIKGDITLCSMEAQGLFINICSFYWMRGCNMSLTGVQHRFSTCSTALDELIKADIFEVNNNELHINFLDDQFDQFEKLAKKKSRAGKASAKIRKSNIRSTSVKHVVNKEDKIRKDKDKEKIPVYEEFKKYALEKKPLVDVSKLKLKYDSWIENDWKDGHGNKIKNWKSKLLNTLPFIDEKLKAGRAEKYNPPSDYGKPSPSAVPMPESVKNRLSNIGNID